MPVSSELGKDAPGWLCESVPAAPAHACPWDGGRAAPGGNLLITTPCPGLLPFPASFRHSLPTLPWTSFQINSLHRNTSFGICFWQNLNLKERILIAHCSLNQVGRIPQWRDKRACSWSGPSLAFSLAPHQSPTPSSEVSSSHHHVVLLRLASSHRGLSIFHHLLRPSSYPTSSPRQFLGSQDAMSHFLPVSWSCLDLDCGICRDKVCVSSLGFVTLSPPRGAWKARAMLG